MTTELKAKRITIDTLAIMIHNGFERMDTKFTKVTREINGINSRLDGMNNRIDDLAMSRVKYEDHDKLKARVEVLEKK